MIQIFKRNGVGQIIILLLVTGLLWAQAIADPPEMVAYDGYAPLYDIVYRFFADHQRASTLVALALTLTESFLFSSTLYNYKMVTQGTLLPSLLYIIAMSLSPALLTLNPTVLMNFALILAVDRLMVIGESSLSVNNVFGSAFYIAIASMFYMPAIFLIVPFLIVFSLYKMYRWRHWIVLALGFLAPYLLLLTYAYLADQLDLTIFLIGSVLTSFNIHIEPCGWLQIVTCFALIALTLVSLFSFLSSNELSADGQRNGVVLALMLLFDVIVFFLTTLFPFNIQVIAIPFAFLTNSFLLHGGKRKWIFETILGLIIVLGLINQIPGLC